MSILYRVMVNKIYENAGYYFHRLGWGTCVNNVMTMILGNSNNSVLFSSEIEGIVPKLKAEKLMN